MRLKRSDARAVLGAILALVFLVAVMPGTMAMPSPQPPTAAASMAGHCGHMKLKDQNTPCKGMSVCVGLLGCLGLAAIVSDSPVLHATLTDDHAPAFAVSAAGLTDPPDTPPPIA